MSEQHDRIVGKLFAQHVKLLEQIAESNSAHADRDGLTGLKRTLFLQRGGHAPGDRCPTAPTGFPPAHHIECRWPEDECECHHYQAEGPS